MRIIVCINSYDSRLKVAHSLVVMNRKGIRKTDSVSIEGCWLIAKRENQICRIPFP